VDLSRRPYKTQCRFWRGSDETATIRWVEVPDTAPVLPYTSAIVSLNLDPTPWLDTGVGEVWRDARPYTGQRLPPALVGSGPCGTQTDFEEGGEYLPNEPPAEYTPRGFLVCCGEEPPPDGKTCATALPVLLGELVNGVSSAATGNQWYVYEGLAPGTYQIDFGTQPALFVVLQTFPQGASCEALSLPVQLDFQNTSAEISPEFPRLYVVVLNLPGTPFEVPFAFQLTSV
jgi:hypothetical protein